MRKYISDRKSVLLFAVLIMIASLAPYLSGFWNAGPDRVFTGFLIGVEDGNSYIAKMIQGSYGKWLFKTPYSAREQQGLIAFLPYMILGKLAAPPELHVQIVVLFHLFRTAAGILMILASYDFISIYIQSNNLRWLALISAVVGGGLGWVLFLFGRNGFGGFHPLDFISPESFGFLSLIGLPHLALARGLFLWSFVSIVKQKEGYKTGLIWLGLGLLQPIFVVLAWVLLGGFVFFKIAAGWLGLNNNEESPRSEWQEIKQGAIAILISAPFIIYTALSFWIDPVLKQWAAQNLIISPPVGHYILVYGAALPFLVIFLVRLSKPIKPELLLLISWIISFPILIYAPVNTQRRLAEGFWVVLVVVVFLSVEKSKGKLLRYGYWFFGLTLPTTLLLFIGLFQTTFKAGKPVYLELEEVQAYQYFQTQDFQDRVVLGAYATGNALPAYSPVRVLVGHGPESYKGPTYLQSVNAFYNQETNNDMRIKLLSENDVTFVFWGPNEREIGGWEPFQENYLIQVYNQNQYQIYRFIDPSG
jgi:hypothetical protein